MLLFEKHTSWHGPLLLFLWSLFSDALSDGVINSSREHFLGLLKRGQFFTSGS